MFILFYSHSKYLLYNERLGIKSCSNFNLLSINCLSNAAASRKKLHLLNGNYRNISRL